MKNINSKTKSRLKNYTLLAGSAVAGITAEAQIQYTDLTPDVVLNLGNTYSLDLNNDMVNDFTLGVQAINTSSSNINVVGNAAGLFTEGANEVMAQQGTTFAVPYITALNANDLISPAGAFMTATASSSGIPGLIRFSGTVDLGFGPIPQNIGNFSNNNQRFIGFKFSIGTNTHYGWARISVPNNASTMTIYDYAYNTAPNQPINAGATAGIEDKQLSDVVALNFANNNINIQVLGINNLHNGKVTVLNLAGQEVLSAPLTNFNTSIPADNLSEGIYLINISFDEGVYTQKLYVSK
jgi:hypothetical protein